ncbi:hypothetical protein [Variovorax paradoxus]|uniref:hypothetical protein n=1 Tax=Variovorax paradoxus TaxID=34073 RepID=UPI001D1797AE|nr:hypothetical protein [Variovorax paradoxus]
MRTQDDKKNDEASRLAHDGGIDPQQALTGTTRRSLLRSAVLFAMFSGSGISLTGCGGGGGGGGGASASVVVVVVVVAVRPMAPARCSSTASRAAIRCPTA